MRRPLPIPSLLRRAGRGGAAFAADEDGTAMVFGAITMFTLVIFTVMVLKVGIASSTSMAMRGAADSAAYAGAEVEANAIDAIGFLNEGMAYTYYNLCRHAVDAEIYRTIMRFRTEHRTPRGTPIPPNTPSPIVVADGPDPAAPIIVAFSNDRSALDRTGHGFMDRQGFRGPASQAAYPAMRNALERGLRYIDEKIRAGEALLEDLRRTADQIARATPHLVAREVWRVAIENGAERVAMYPTLEDLEQIWRPGGPAFPAERGGPNSPSHRFVERALRYQERSLRVDGSPVELPDWFDPYQGQALAGVYYQTRMCWNEEDLAHSDEWGPHMGAPFSQFMRAPNGHWHFEHMHYEMGEYGEPIPVGPHENGHLMHDEDGIHAQVQARSHPMDTQIRFPHHAVVICPTCRPSPEGPAFDNDGDRFTDVRHRNVPESIGGASWPRRIRWTPPLVLDERALRTGVSVAVWRSPRNIGFAERLLPDPEWGYVAVATARPGILRDDGTVDVSGRSFARGEGNLFHGAVRWSARLVPADLASVSRSGTDIEAARWWRDLLQGHASWRAQPEGAPADDVRQRLERWEVPGYPGRSFRPGDAADRGLVVH